MATGKCLSKRVAAWLIVSLVVTGLAACGQGNDPDSSPYGGNGHAGTESLQLSFLHASGSRIVDSRGRQVLLRGLNMPGLRSNRHHPPYRQNGKITPAADLFTLQDLQNQDFAIIAGMGFNVIRLILTWEFAEPDPPPAFYSKSYFHLVDQAIQKANAHGLYVILDFGQYGWGRSLGGNTGAPAWTVSRKCNAKAHAKPGQLPQTAPAVTCAYTEFWKNESVNGTALQDAYIKLWQFVAQRYKNNPGVAAYDLYNEPLSGNIDQSIFDDQYLYPFYRRLAKAIRQVDPKHAVGFQPKLLHSVGVHDLAAARPLGIPNAIYLPHDYTGMQLTVFLESKPDPSLPPDHKALIRKSFKRTSRKRERTAHR
jgi:endoglycosylceramidase